LAAFDHARKIRVRGCQIGLIACSGMLINFKGGAPGSARAPDEAAFPQAP